MGERIPFRIAPPGDGAQNSDATPTANDLQTFPTPADLPEADWWAARNMADALSRKGDYTDALTGYFLPQIAQNSDAGLTELRAAHAELGRMDPGAASLLASQFEEQSGQPLHANSLTSDAECAGSQGETIPDGQTGITFRQDSCGTDTGGADGIGSGDADQPGIQVAEAPADNDGAPGGSFRSKLTPDEIFQRAQGNGGWLSNGADKDINGGKECVALVKAVVPEIGPTSQWHRGEDIQGDGNPPLKPGTAIASGWNAQDGYSSNETGNHAAIFLGWEYDSGGRISGMKILDQWAARRRADGTIRAEKAASVRTIPLDDARKYSVIKHR
jgi:hypothetical protein